MNKIETIERENNVQLAKKNETERNEICTPS